MVGALAQRGQHQSQENERITHKEPTMSGPLSELKVLDFSTLLPGPYATMMLADMGATVLRVEAPDRVDLAKVMPPFDGKFSTTFSYLSRGKETLPLNLKSAGSVEKIKELVREYDIVVEQFRPGVMGRLGIGYEVLKAENPSLIYCAITGYGQTGPYRDRAGHDINYLALSGVASHCGRQDSGPPPLGIQVADVAGGSHHAVMGILAAVIKRQQTGEGSFIDISMTDAAFAMNAMAGAAALAGGQEQRPEGGVLNGGSFYDYYQTSDGRWLSIGSLEPQFSARLLDTLDLSDLNKYAMSQTPEHQANLKQAIGKVIAKRPLEEWQTVFADVDACVEPVLTIEEAAEHPQLQEREMTIEVDRGDGVTQLQVNSPLRF